MHFGTNSLKMDYSMDEKVLQKEKDLGVMISDDLSFTPMHSSIL